MLICLATLAYITYYTVNFSFVISSIGFAYYVGPSFSLSPSSKGFQKFKRFQNTCYFSLYVKLWGTAQRLVSHIFTFPKTCKKNPKNIGFLWHGICIVISQHMFEFGADIRIFKQKMCKCSIVRDTI